MLRLLLLTLLLMLSLLGAPQLQPGPVPPEVDQELRTRIREFYQLQVDHQFRRAEDLVAEDSKEFYYESRKPEIKSFSIERIDYLADFKSAAVKIRGKVQVVFPGAPPMVIESVSPAAWKLDNGKWCWFYDQNSVMDTPMGKVVGSAPGKAPADPVAMFSSTAAAAIKGAVQAEPQEIAFDATHPQVVTITLKNVLPGPVSLTTSAVPGLTVSIAKPNLGPNESTQVTIAPVTGSRERPDFLMFGAQPVNQSISIRISWAQ
jgi:hypothetical protein